MRKLERWEKKLLTKANAPRTGNVVQDALEMIDAHVFGNVSYRQTCTVPQPSRTKQGLITRK